MSIRLQVYIFILLKKIFNIYRFLYCQVSRTLGFKWLLIRHGCPCQNVKAVMCIIMFIFFREMTSTLLTTLIYYILTYSHTNCANRICIKNNTNPAPVLGSDALRAHEEIIGNIASDSILVRNW